ncbi:hypothetical protein [Allorhodopirellula solitaria]|uniref:hypothetical protein n=1 Tax=Allorhodopirellula solitaria TaxID=2527987 RepID=UPI0011B753A9|nr:hypothetical protein [Allorhodopirellula solitaria]
MKTFLADKNQPVARQLLTICNRFVGFGLFDPPHLCDISASRAPKTVNRILTFHTTTIEAFSLASRRFFS